MTIINTLLRPEEGDETMAKYFEGCAAEARAGKIVASILLISTETKSPLIGVEPKCENVCAMLGQPSDILDLVGHVQSLVVNATGRLLSALKAEERHGPLNS